MDIVDIFGYEYDRRSRVGEILLFNILENPFLERIIVIGEAGSGKTLLVEQLSAFIAEVTHRDVIKVIYDDFLEDFIYRHGFGPTDDWGKKGKSFEQGLSEEKIRAMLSSKMLEFEEEVRNNAIKKGKNPPFVIVETPAIGVQDRGTSALRQWALDDKEGHTRNIILATVADPFVEEAAGELRQLVGESASLEETQEKLEILNQVRVGLKKPQIWIEFPDSAHDPVFWRECILRTFNNAANLDEIKSLSDEVSMATERIIEKYGSARFDEICGYIRISNLDRMLGYSLSEFGQMIRKAVYTRIFLIDELGFSQRQIFVVANLFSKNKVVYPDSLFKKTI